MNYSQNRECFQKIAVQIELKQCMEPFGSCFYSHLSLRGRCLKGKGEGVLGKGVLGARETRGARDDCHAGYSHLCIEYV